MAKTLSVELVTPEKVVLQGRADFVVLPAWEGEMGVLPGHEPFLVQLKHGEVRVTEGRELRRLAVTGGFAEVGHDKVVLFAETAEMAEQIDAERERQALEKAKAERAQKDIDPLTLAAAEAAIRRAQVRLMVAQRGRRRAGPHEPSPTHEHKP